MNIVNWNCDKSIPTELFVEHEGIFLLQECGQVTTSDFEWEPSINSAGIAIGSDTYSIEDVIRYPAIETALTVRFEELEYPVTNIWARNSEYNTRYIGQIDKLLGVIDEPHIIGGDFNWNVNVEDANTTPVRFLDVVQKFNELDMVSCYHTLTGEIYGSESQHTLRMKSTKNTYHHDFIFVPEDVIIDDMVVDASVESDHALLRANITV